MKQKGLVRRVTSLKKARKGKAKEEGFIIVSPKLCRWGDD